MFSKHQKEIHKVTIQVAEDGDILKRIALLNTALLKVIAGATLIKVESANYEKGCIEILVEAGKITPSIVPGEVTVRVEKW